MKNEIQPIQRSTKLANYLVAVMLVLVPFHAFLTVWLSSLVGHYTLLRLWGDTLLLVLLGLSVWWLARDKSLCEVWTKNLIVRLIVAYAGLSLLLGVVSLLKGEVRPEALAYGLLVNLRYFAWFLAVSLLAQRSDKMPNNWPRLLLLPAAVVVLFAGFQYTLLPHDFLSHFGYNTGTTIPPIETINHNSHYIRVQATLRGANPLGAYLVIIASALSVLLLRGRRRALAIVFGVVTLFALYASGSRSAWLGTVIAIITTAWLSLTTAKARKLVALGSVGVIVLLTAAGLLLRNQLDVENALLHTQKHSTVSVSSNAAHASALKQGLSDAWHQPFGDGPGTAGQASAYNTPHPTRIAEDYYVQIAQETGWLGLMLFVSIVALVGRELYRRSSQSALALTAFASLLGISFVCLLSHAWSDDTLAFTWWGLAGIALAAPPQERREV